MGSRIGPILIVEDDEDDQHALTQVFQDLEVANELKFFHTCPDAYHYLETTEDKPFLIFCDINLPGMTGADLKRKINANTYLRRKSIPFVFLTTTAANSAILDAYESLAQGFFTKPNTMEPLKRMIELILSYWKISKHPDPI
jgi:CheY-like chemotaxis protein